MGLVCCCGRLMGLRLVVGVVVVGCSCHFLLLLGVRRCRNWCSSLLIVVGV